MRAAVRLREDDVTQVTTNQRHTMKTTPKIRKQVIAIAQADCRRLRDSGEMYSPYGTHHLLHSLRKAGVPYPQTGIDPWIWLKSLKLTRMWIALHNEGCMIAGYTRRKRPKSSTVRAPQRKKLRDVRFMNPLLDLLHEVQTGECSCRKAAKEIIAANQQPAETSKEAA
jgi:hypothetical protein